MCSVQEKYEEVVCREDTVIHRIHTYEIALSLLMDGLLYRHRGETCLETVKTICESIREQEEVLRQELFAIRWEKRLLACEFPGIKTKAEVSEP